MFTSLSTKTVPKCLWRFHEGNLRLKLDVYLRVGAQGAVEADDVAEGVFHFDALQVEGQVSRTAVGQHDRFHFCAVIGAHFSVVDECFHGWIV